MKIEVLVEQQAHEYIQRQPPDARKQLRDALHALENQKIFPDPLEDELEGFYKIRVNCHRLVLQLERSNSGPRFKVVFAERRGVVYELFSQILGLQ